MARTVKDSALDSRAARLRLKVRGRPYFRDIDGNLHLGYRRLKSTAGTWWARAYLGNGDYQMERIGVADDISDADGIEILNWRQAQKMAREKREAHTKARPGPAGPLTVGKAVAEYINFLEVKRKSALDSSYRARAFIYDQLGDLPIADLTSRRLQAWLSEIADAAPRLRTRQGEAQKHRELATGDEAIRQRRSTANRTLTVLKAALNRAWRDADNGIASDAAWRSVEPFEAVESARVRYLTAEEAFRVVNASDPEFRPLVKAALLTGARYGELVRLEVGDFNPDSETLAIRTSKSGKSRHVELSEEGAAFFRQHCAGRSGSELMFAKREGGAWGKSHQCRPMLETCRRAKITPPINFHGLRHTWASLAVMNGVPLLVVAKNLGHTDSRMVERHYGHMAPSYIRNAIRAGAPFFGIVSGSNIAPLRGST